MSHLLNRDLQSVAIDVVDSTGRVPRTEMAWLSDHLVKTASYLKVEGEVRCRIIGDDEMVAMHTQYSNDPTTTDVLTFDLTEGAAAAQAAAGKTPVLDVDLTVCLDEAKRQALARQHDARRELLLYCLHGMLHCIGHDDHDDAAFERMHRFEDEVLSAVGVGPTFRVVEGDAPEAGR